MTPYSLKLIDYVLLLQMKYCWKFLLVSLIFGCLIYLLEKKLLQNSHFQGSASYSVFPKLHVKLYIFITVILVVLKLTL